jgi:DNA-binding NarL/FixJ family response regulator
MAKIRVLLVEDHTVVRQGLRRILEIEPEIEIVGEVGDGRAAVDAATVESHRKHVMDKLDLHNTAAMVRFAVRKGLIR